MSVRNPTVLIVGGGAAGNACATTLRRSGFEGGIRIVDAAAPVNRTLVNKGVLAGLLTPEQIALPAAPDVERISGHAVGLDLASRTVRLEDGSEVSGDVLVIASGSRPRETAAADGIHRLHTVDDALALAAAVPEPAGARVAIIGAGFIGTELAAHYAGLGADVILIGRSDAPLSAALGAQLGGRLGQLHRDKVDARFGVGSYTVTVRASDVLVEPDAGAPVEADVCIVAQGTEPATEWAGAPAGVEVDDHLRVLGHPSTYAAGSAALLDIDGQRIRIDHWDDSAAQGAHLARTLLHDLQGAEDPGAYRPRTGFTLNAYGSIFAARGILVPAGSERDGTQRWGEGSGPDAAITEFLDGAGELSGIAGVAAGAAVMRAAAAL